MTKRQDSVGNRDVFLPFYFLSCTTWNALCVVFQPEFSPVSLFDFLEYRELGRIKSSSSE